MAAGSGLTQVLAGAEALSGMPGPQRAAALLLMLGETEGAPIWQRLEEDEIRAVTHAMVGLGSLDTKSVERLIVEFVARLSSTSGLSANFERTEALLLKIFPAEQVSMIMSEIKGASGRRVWASIAQVDPETLAAYLRNEYPQTVAVVLSKVRPDCASKVLVNLPEDFAIDVLNRMLRLDTVQKEALRHIEETLRVEFVTAIAQTAGRDAHEMMADVFNTFDKPTETRFLAALDQSNRGSAKRIRDLMFTFEDLLKLDAGGVQTLLRTVPNDVLCRALKGADEQARAFFLKQMSTRAAKNVTDEIASLGAVRLKEVEEAQNRMTAAAKELVEQGEITLSRSGAEEELVY